MTEREAKDIGRGWVIAIAALLVLLILGIVLYLRMSAPLRQQSKHPAVAFLRQAETEVGRYGFVAGRDGDQRPVFDNGILV